MYMCGGGRRWKELAEAKGVTGSAQEPAGVLRGQLQQQETTHHMTGDTWQHPGGQTAQGCYCSLSGQHKKPALEAISQSVCSVSPLWQSGETAIWREEQPYCRPTASVWGPLPSTELPQECCPHTHSVKQEMDTVGRGGTHAPSSSISRAWPEGSAGSSNPGRVRVTALSSQPRRTDVHQAGGPHALERTDGPYGREEPALRWPWG